MIPVGYLINKKNGISGDRGSYYDYILAGNGLFIEADNPLVRARIRIADCPVRALEEIHAYIHMKHGKIPGYLFELALNWFYLNSHEERFASVVWNGEYHLECPEQEGTAGAVKYHPQDNTILDLHSHGKIKAFFSGQDNRDEQGFHLYGVIGTLNENPTLKLRVGCYSYYQSISPADVFEGDLSINTGDKDDL